MEDKPVSVTIVGAAFLWIAGLVLAAVYSIHGYRGTDVWAFIAVAAGATLTIRHFLIRLACVLLERERNAFLLGQDVQRLRSTR